MLLFVWLKRHYAIQGECVAMMENGYADGLSDSSNCEQLDPNFDDPPKKKGKNSGKQMLVKGSDEYLKKRARNNEAVRKSRVKSKKKIEETQLRVSLLTKENSDLKTKVTLLTKELNVLRSLFANGGINVPDHVSVEKTLEVKSEPKED